MLALVMVLLLIAGCGNGSSTASQTEETTTQETAAAASTDSATPTTEATDEPAAAEESGTRIVKTEMGDVEIPANPQRVIVNWYVIEPLMLGVEPVAISGWAQETMPFYDELSKIPVIEKWEQEDLLAYDPDLIITYDPQDYEKFSKIAPVLVYGEGSANGKTALDRLEFFGEALGREAEAQTAIDTFNEKLADAKEKLGSGAFEGKTFSILEDWGRESYGIYYESGSRGGTLLYDYIGLSKPEKLEKLIEESGEGRGSLSYEVASQYFGDYVLWFLQEDYDSEYAKSDIWKSIPAVQDGHVIEIPGNYLGLFYYDDVASMTGQLDYIVGRLLEVE